MVGQFTQVVAGRAGVEPERASEHCRGRGPVQFQILPDPQPPGMGQCSHRVEVGDLPWRASHQSTLPKLCTYLVHRMNAQLVCTVTSGISEEEHLMPHSRKTPTRTPA